MLAIQKPNVDVHFTEVVEITDNSIIGKNGVRKEVDTIICATGKLSLPHLRIFFSPPSQDLIHRSDPLSQSWDEMVSTSRRNGG
jgi:hypothetical protein